MEAKDLRIGNWVYRDHEITDVHHSTLRYLCENDSKGFYKPIPLTEEWLIKFGLRIFKNKEFNNKISAVIIVDEFHNILINESSYSSQLQVYLNTNFKDKESNKITVLIEYIEHVHQLQNLYFALTGNELELNEKLANQE